MPGDVGWLAHANHAGQTLLHNHDLLLLDEPTNHLDHEATIWLESFLSEWKGGMVVITGSIIATEFLNSGDAAVFSVDGLDHTELNLY